MSKDVAGSVRGVAIDGIPYRVAGDANFSQQTVNVENSMIPSSGVAMRKMTKKVPVVEGVTLLVNNVEMEAIKSRAESLDILKLQYTVASGSVFRSEGQINVEAHETEENKANMQFLPNETWTLFPA